MEKTPFIREAYYTHGQSPKTGRRFTICALIREGRTFIGIAQCSTLDQFSRSMGRKISLNKAVHSPLNSTENTDKKIAIDLIHQLRSDFEK